MQYIIYDTVAPHIYTVKPFLFYDNYHYNILYRHAVFIVIEWSRRMNFVEVRQEWSIPSIHPRLPP